MLDQVVLAIMLLVVQLVQVAVVWAKVPLFKMQLREQLTLVAVVAELT